MGFRFAIALAATAIAGATLTYHDHQRRELYRIDSAPESPARDQLLRPSYVDGYSHGQIAIFRQMNRIYPTARVDLTNPDENARTIAPARYPQIVLNDHQCIVETRLGWRNGHKCIPYGG